MKTTTEQRIRKIIASKIKVRICTKSRSHAGFTVKLGSKVLLNTPLKKASVNFLLAYVQCLPKLLLTIEPTKK